MNAEVEPQGGFVQFSLCMLATKDDFKAALGQAFSSAVLTFLDSKSKVWRYSQRRKDKALKLAQEAIKFTNGDIEQIIRDGDRAAAFEQAWRKAGRTTCAVRIKTGWFFDALHGAMTEREFRILVAIFSALGSKPYVKLGWPPMQWRAAGVMKPPATYTDGLPFGPTFPRGQIERTLAELIARGLVTSVTYRKGERYWTNRMIGEELWKLIAAAKMRRAETKAARQKRDTAESEAIRARLQSLINVSAECPHAARSEHLAATSR